MYCPNCGKELSDSSSKFCPECGHSINNANPHSSSEIYQNQLYSSNRLNLRTAMFLICAFSIIVITILFLGAAMFADYSDGIYDFVYEDGGIYVIIGLGVIAAITGIIGLCSKSN